MVTTRRGSTSRPSASAKMASSPTKKAGKKRKAPENEGGGEGGPAKSKAGKKHKAPEHEGGGEGETAKKKPKAATPKKVQKMKSGARAKRAGKKATVKKTEVKGGGKMTEEADEEKEKAPEREDEMADANPKSAVSVSASREQKVEDSPIVEKGLVYFFLRGKVDVEHPESMDEVKRSYIILRPLPQGAKLVDGKLEDAGENRLIVIPKKRLPKKGYERFLTFVEEPSATLQELRNYLKGRTYQTKTVGERTDFPAQPIGEGVYAITKSNNERQSHFVYMLTIPTKPDELQEDFGLKEKESFVISVRNPQTPSPPNAAIPDPAEYSKEIIEEFRGLRWGSVQPKHFVKNAEFLFIGERKFPEDGDHEGTADEVAQLEEEDEKRISHLKGDESVFADLELSQKEFMGIQTTWGKDDDEV